MCWEMAGAGGGGGLFPICNFPSRFTQFFFYGERENRKQETNLKAVLTECDDIQKNVPRYYKNEPKLTLVTFYQL